MNNCFCRIYEEQMNLLNQLPKEERGTVLYCVLHKAFLEHSKNKVKNQNDNQLENQLDNQIDYQLEFAYLYSLYTSLSNISKVTIQLLNKTTNCIEYSTNYGGKRTGAGRKEKQAEIKKETPRPLKEKINIDFVAEEFKAVFQKWLDYKKEKKQAYKGAISAEQCYKHLMELAGNDFAIAEKIVNQSISNNWAGLFSLKEKGGNKNDGCIDYNGKDADVSKYADFLGQKIQVGN